MADDVPGQRVADRTARIRNCPVVRLGPHPQGSGPVAEVGQDSEWTGLGMDSRWTRNGLEMDSERTRIGLGTDSEWTRNGLGTDLERTRNGVTEERDVPVGADGEGWNGQKVETNGEPGLGWATGRDGEQ